MSYTFSSSLLRRALLLASLATVLAAAGCKHDSPTTPPPPITKEGVGLDEKQTRYIDVKPAEADTVGALIKTTGRVTYDEEKVARLAVPVSGRVMKMMVQPGDRVKAGQALSIIHSPDIAAAEANLAQDRAQRIQTEQSLNRAKRLQQSGAGSDREVEEATTNLVQAKAAEEKDLATLRVLGGGVSNPSAVFNLRSPIDGTVTERHATLGGAARVEDTNPLFIVADLSRLWVLVDVFEQDIALVAKNTPVEVTVPSYPDKVFVGNVLAVGDVVDPATRTVKVRILMPNPDGFLKPEMFARVTLHSPSTAAARVPTSAVLTRADKTYLFVEDSPRHYVPREVYLGARTDQSVQILRGVKPGDQVVAKGGLLLDAEMKQRL
jgi:cobalt-zinc-cadmium efflux system membrane fusion protein